MLLSHGPNADAGARAPRVMTEPAPDDEAGHPIVRQHLPPWVAPVDASLRSPGFGWAR